MKASFLLRTACALGAGLLLAACNGGVVVDFAAPFPAEKPLPAFPARHQGVYTASDSSKSLCIGPTAVWRQELQHQTRTRHELDSMHLPLSADSTYLGGNGQLHYMHLMSNGTVRDSWLWCDTIFSLAGDEAGQLRRLQGRYYLSIPTSSGKSWKVQRLDVSGRRLTWEALGQDTLRLQVLDPASVRREVGKGTLYFHLTPEAGRQTRRIGRYDGLWQPIRAYQRRY